MLERSRYLTRQYGVSAFMSPLMTAWHFVLSPTDRKAPKECLDALEKRYHALLRRDLDNVARGIYPRELLFDFPTRKYLRQLPIGIVEFPRIFLRRALARYRDVPPIEDAGSYPDYYLRTFHWQTDGWLSDRSARLYDLSVETLFMGTADVMRRMVIPPVVDATRGIDHPRILDVACGTGKLLHHLHRTIPSARLYGLDLSPYYLNEAKRVLEKVPGVSLVADNAESMPFKDESFDAVTSVFLFHELPRDARRNVMREVLRVLRPGGVFVISDSAQPSESPEMAFFLDIFPRLYHEPYFKAYLRDDLGQALEEEGFRLRSCEVQFVSKVVIGEKPAAR